MARTSLRLRLLLAVGAVTLLALVVTDVIVYKGLHDYLYQQVDASLEASHHAVELAAEHPGGAVDHDAPPIGPGGPGGSAFCAAGRESAPGMFLAVRTTEGDVITGVAGREDCPAFVPGTAPVSPQLPVSLGTLQPEPGNPDELVAYFTAPSAEPGGPTFRVRVSTLPDGDLLFVATPLTSVTSTLSRLATVEWIVTLGALLAALLVGLWLVRVGLAPLRDVERTADAIAEGDLERRVTNANPRTEVGHLAATFNVMAARVEELVTELRASEARLRRFVGDASHELRTPIAAVSAYAQLFSRGAATHEEDLGRVAEGIERETARMGRLVEDLLLLAKLDEHEPLASAPVELTGLALEARDTSSLVGPAWPVEVQASGPVEVRGDEPALRRVLDNLLANVRAHTPPGTRTVVSVGVSDGLARLEVRDDGPGLDAAQAAAVFERFFRADPSRSRSTGGAGLGLSIVASIVEAHGGEVRCEPLTRGVRFVVTLPLLADGPRAQVGPLATDPPGAPRAPASRADGA